MKNIFYKIISFILSFVLLLPMVQPVVVYAEDDSSSNISSAETSEVLEIPDESFQIYLAKFLKHFPKLESDLKQNMLHRQLYEMLREEDSAVFGFDWDDLIFWNQILTNSDIVGQVTGQEKVILYREMLLEIINMHLESDEMAEFMQSGYDYWNSALLNFLEAYEIGLDLGPEVISGGAIYQVVNGLKEGELKDLCDDLYLHFSKCGYNMKLGETKIGVDFPLAGLKMMVSAMGSSVECIAKMPTYLALAECRDGLLGSLKVMYRQTQDADLQKALMQIIECMEADAGDEDIAKLVEKMELETAVSGIQDIAKDFLLDALGMEGFMITLSELLTNLVFNTENIVEAYLMLEAVVKIEDEVKKAISYSISLNPCEDECPSKDDALCDKAFSYEDSIVLNQSVALLYDVYEYGTELANIFFEETYESGFWNEVQKSDLTIYNRYREDFGKETVESIRTCYPKWVKTYRNIAIVGRSVFDSVWQMYQEDYKEQLAVLEEHSVPILVEELNADSTVIVLQENGQGRVNVTVTPSNAENALLTYKSSDENVVTVDYDGFLKAHNAGAAEITIATEDKTKVIQSVVWVKEPVETDNQDISVEVEWRDAESFSHFCEENEDGITLKGYFLLPREECIKQNILDVVQKTALFDYNSEYYLFMPAYVNGQPVTEVDIFSAYNEVIPFDDGDWEKYYEDGWYIPLNRQDDRIYIQGTDLVIKNLPSTVKRISENCFSDCTFSNSFVLHDGVEEIGENAFSGSTFLGWESEEEKKTKELENTFFEIPSSVRKLGSSAFWDCKFGYRSLVINAKVDEISPGCFYSISEVDKIRFAEESTIKNIGSGAFEDINIAGIWLPDSVETIEGHAFRNSKWINNLPANLQVIESYAFASASFAECMTECVFPEGIREIQSKAFYYLENGLEIIYLPDTLEVIGNNAFRSMDLSKLYAYESTATDKPKGKIESFAFDQTKVEYMEIPGNIVSLGHLEVAGELVLPAGLEELYELKGIDGNPWTVRVAEGEAGQNGVIHRKIYINGCRYLELPGAFVQCMMDGAEIYDEFDEFCLSTTVWSGNSGITYTGEKNSRQVPIIRIKGEVKPTDKWLDFMKKCVSQELYALDEYGREICLYRGPSSYEKVSVFQYENFEDYLIDFPEETERITNQKIRYTVSDNQGRMSYRDMVVRVNVEESMLSAMKDGKPRIDYWTESFTDSREAELGTYFYFEDLYLKQLEYAYFQISLQGANGETLEAPEGTYQIITQLPSNWNNFGLYYISDTGLITRLSGEIYQEGDVREFRALSDELGCFALVKCSNLSKRVSANWMEEVHEIFRDQKTCVDATAKPGSEVSKESVSVDVTEDSETQKESQKVTNTQEIIVDTKPDKQEISNGNVYVWENDSDTAQKDGAQADSDTDQKDGTQTEESAALITSQVKKLSEDERVLLKEELGLTLSEEEQVLEICTTEKREELTIYVETTKDIRPILVYVDEQKKEAKAQKLKKDQILTEETDALQGTMISDMNEKLQNEVKLKKAGRYLVILSAEKMKSSVITIILRIIAAIILIPICIVILLFFYYRAQHKRRMKRIATRKRR